VLTERVTEAETKKRAFAGPEVSGTSISCPVWITDAGLLVIIRRGADASNKDLATIIARPVKWLR
jgi:hypothetical protein